MGDKNSGRNNPPPAPTAPPPQANPAEFLAPMQQMMAGLFESQQASTMQMMEMFNSQYSGMLENQMSRTDLVEVDWAAERASIRARLAFSGAEETDPRQGRGSTIVTSPLLDGQQPDVLEPVALGEIDEDS